MQFETLLSTKEVAVKLGVSARAVTQWANLWLETGGREGVPGIRFCKRGRWRFDKDVIDALIASKQKSLAA
jgi:hypothetical protein